MDAKTMTGAEKLSIHLLICKLSSLGNPSMCLVILRLAGIAIASGSLAMQSSGSFNIVNSIASTRLSM